MHMLHICPGMNRFNAASPKEPAHQTWHTRTTCMAAPSSSSETGHSVCNTVGEQFQMQNSAPSIMASMTLAAVS